jgi:hypothetical protein
MGAIAVTLACCGVATAWLACVARMTLCLDPLDREGLCANQLLRSLSKAFAAL